MANGGMIQRSASTPALRFGLRDVDADSQVRQLATLRRRPSAISLEKHGSLIFDEINSLLDGEDSSGSSDAYAEDLIDREVTPGERGGLPRRMSELSLDSFEGDDDDHHRRHENVPRASRHQNSRGAPRRAGSQDIPRSPPRAAAQAQIPRRASCGNIHSRVSILTRIEQQVIDKGVRDGKLVRTSSHVSFRGPAVRRIPSVSVIREDRELSHEDVVIVMRGMAGAWEEDEADEEADDPEVFDAAAMAPVVNGGYAHSYLNDEDQEDDDALFF